MRTALRLALTAASASRITDFIALGGLGSASFNFTAPAEAKAVRIYRCTSGAVLDRVAHLLETRSVSPGQPVSGSEGDLTRTNLLTNPGFAADTDWTKGTGWTIGSGQATHAAGTSSILQQAVATLGAASVGAFFRSGITTASISGASASATMRLIGGTSVNIAAATAAGVKLGRGAKVSGNTDFGIVCTAVSAATIDDLVLFDETVTCMTQGVYDYYVEPLNSAGAPGALSVQQAVVVY